MDSIYRLLKCNICGAMKACFNVTPNEVGQILKGVNDKGRQKMALSNLIEQNGMTCLECSQPRPIPPEASRLIADIAKELSRCQQAISESQREIHSLHSLCT